MEKISDEEMQEISDSLYHFGVLPDDAQPKINRAFSELRSLRSLNKRLVEDGERLVKWMMTTQLEPPEDDETREMLSNDLDKHTDLMKEIGG